MSGRRVPRNRRLSVKANSNLSVRFQPRRLLNHGHRAASPNGWQICGRRYAGFTIQPLDRADTPYFSCSVAYVRLRICVIAYGTARIVQRRPPERDAPVVPWRKHNQSVLAAQNEYTSRVVRFFGEHLTGEGQCDEPRPLPRTRRTVSRLLSAKSPFRGSKVSTVATSASVD